MASKLVGPPRPPKPLRTPAAVHSSAHTIQSSANRYIKSRRFAPTLSCDPIAALPADMPDWELARALEAVTDRVGSTQAQTYGYREIPSQPERILDAPDILDDYYLNLLDWGSCNQLAVALRNTLYLWDANSGGVTQLIENSSLITSLSWTRDGHSLAVGDANSCLTLYDAATGRSIRSLLAHQDRVSSLAWNGSVLSSGSRDSTIVQHDVRADRYFVRLSGHEQEVCGLRWSADGCQLASGGNDNKMCIWEMTSSVPRFKSCEHTAAVKALAWCPWKSNLLASGGGTADKSIKLWNTANSTCVQSVDTGSQVCALEWNRHDRELLSAHGYSKNQLALWRYPDLSKVAELTGHSARVLFMSQSPDGSTVVSAGADETLRFWKVFESSVKKGGKGDKGGEVLFQLR